MKKLFVPIVAAALFVLAFASHARTFEPARVQSQSQNAVELKLAMRKLWEDHITYTRNLIISQVAGLLDQAAVTQRLLANQDDIGKALKPYYGDAAGDSVARLLRDHIVIAAEVIKAAQGTDANLLAAQQRRWSDNARAIAEALARLNPFWNERDLLQRLQKHLDLTTAEVASRIRGDWNGDIQAYDEGHVHVLEFADLLADGIAKQFASEFGG